jgi:hypothetical protein
MLLKVQALIKLCKKGRRNTLRDITAQWNEESELKLSRECCRQWIHKSGLKFYKLRHKNFNLKVFFYNMKAKEKPLLTRKQKNSYFYIKCVKRVFFVHEKVFYAETKVEAV